MSILSTLLICLCIGVEAFWEGFYIKCRCLSFTKFTITLAFLGSFIVCLAALFFGNWLLTAANFRLKDEITGLLFGILGTLSLTENFKRNYDTRLKFDLSRCIYDQQKCDSINCIYAFFSGIVTSLSAIVACIALGLQSITSPIVSVLISSILIFTMVYGSKTKSKDVLRYLGTIYIYLPGSILCFIGLLKFF